jgi:hypothetical protein
MFPAMPPLGALGLKVRRRVSARALPIAVPRFSFGEAIGLGPERPPLMLSLASNETPWRTRGPRCIHTTMGVRA